MVRICRYSKPANKITNPVLKIRPIRRAFLSFRRIFVLSCNRFFRNTTNLNSQTTTHRILGVDPGTNVLGYAILEIHNKTLTVLHLGVIHFKKDEEHPYRLERIFTQLQKIISDYLPREMAIEAPFFGKNVQSMLKLGRAQGVAMAAAITKGVPITEYSPKKIKQVVTGNGNASKEQVSAMLSTTLGVNLQDQILDATDALAAAVCHYYSTRNGSAASSAKSGSGWGSFIANNPDRVKKR